MSGKLWEVVGGKDYGGILVREGMELQSRQLPERLATGSLVRAVEINGDRLNFDLVDGSGPSSGWVSLKAKGNPLVVAAGPVLVCFYSGGMKATQGQSSLKFLVTKAAEAGFRDSIILDHPGDEGLEDCTSWEQFLSRLAAKVDEKPRHQGRPVVIVAHSHGSLHGFGLAKKLGDRCVKLYVLGRRSPDVPFHIEVWGVETAAAFRELEDSVILKGMLAAWPNSFLEMYKDKSPLPDNVAAVLATVREQYSTPWVPCGFPDQAVADMEALGCPIMGIAASRELPRGETAEKMKGWERLTSSSFELRTVDEHHMGLVGPSSPALPVLIEDMRQLLQI